MSVVIPKLRSHNGQSEGRSYHKEPIRRKDISQRANQNPKYGNIFDLENKKEVNVLHVICLKVVRLFLTNDKARLLVKPDSDLRGGSYSTLNTTGSGIKKQSFKEGLIEKTTMCLCQLMTTIKEKIEAALTEEF